MRHHPDRCSRAASLTSDSYDGNIYALYAGNGSLVPPATTLADSQAAGTGVWCSISMTAAPASLLPGRFGTATALGTVCRPDAPDHTRSRTAKRWCRRPCDLLARTDSPGGSAQWRGSVLLDQDGQVPLDAINQAISKATASPLPRREHQSEFQRAQHRSPDALIPSLKPLTLRG